MLRSIVAFAAVLFLAACGGRAAQPVALETALDSQLSCSHLRGELERNILRLSELRGESEAKVGNNMGMLLVSPFFLDVSDTQTVEAQAIVDRNTRLMEMAQGRDCQDIRLEDFIAADDAAS